MVDQVNKIKILQPINDNIRRCRDVDAKEAINKTYDFDQPFIICGQSNADGEGAFPSIAEYPNRNVILYDKSNRFVLCTEPAGRTGDAWIDNKPAGNLTTPGDKFSFVTTLGKAVLHYCGIKPLLIPCAIGSTAMINWAPSSSEDDVTTLFGAMTKRTRDVMRYVSSDGYPIFVWFGHEADSDDVTENLSTGVLGTEYISSWVDMMTNIRARFPNSIIIFAQLATHDNASLASELRRAAESQRRTEYIYGDSTNILSWKKTSIPIDFSSWGSAQTDENNNATVLNGQLTLTWDGSKILEGFIDTLKPNTYYKLNVTATGSSSWRFFSDATQIGNTRSAGTIDIEFLATQWGSDTSRARARFVEPSGTTPGSITIKINSLEEAVYPLVDKSYMIVTHDLPRNANPDGYHLNTDGLKEVGLRYAKCYAERILGMHWINGTGPRLSSITKPTAATVKVKFNKTIQSNSNGYGVNLASSLFRVYDDGAEKTLTSVERDPADDTAVLITCSTDNTGVVVVTYGDRAGPADATWRQGVVYDSDNMPAPQFGPVVATA